MPDSEDARPTLLRSVELSPPETGHEDATARVRAAVDAVNAKLYGPGGFEGMIAWLHQAERLVAATSDDELEHTRQDIRELIEKLLALNAEVQTVARLKRLLG